MPAHDVRLLNLIDVEGRIPGSVHRMKDIGILTRHHFVEYTLFQPALMPWIAGEPFVKELFDDGLIPEEAHADVVMLRDVILREPIRPMFTRAD